MTPFQVLGVFAIAGTLGGLAGIIIRRYQK
jgi:hypothetical protein